MSDEEAAARRAHRDHDELIGHLQRIQGDGVHGTREQQQQQQITAEKLVTWGWTRLGPGEEVRRKQVPRNSELSLRDELAATIAGFSTNVPQTVGLAEHLLENGWTKPTESERVALDLVKDAFRQAHEAWKKFEEAQFPLSEVSADASALTSDVKVGSHAHQILKVFAAAEGPLYFPEAAERAAGRQVSTQEPEVWDLWSGAFRSLVKHGLVEAPLAPEGTARRFQLTKAGRSVATWGGCGTCDKVRGGCDFCCGTNTGDGSREELSSGDTLPAAGPPNEALILAAFASANWPLEYTEACDAAARVTPRPAGDWHLWETAFRSLEQRGLIEASPAAEGEIRRWQLTQTGRALHELDGVDG